MIRVLIGIIIHGFLIIGLIKPSLVLRWSKKPTRLKVLAIWFISSFVAAYMIDMTKNKAEQIVGDAKQMIKRGEYNNAKGLLFQVDSLNTKYEESQSLIKQIDSAIKIKDSIAAVNEWKNSEPYKDSIATEELKGTLLLVEKSYHFASNKSSLEDLKSELLFFYTVNSDIYKYTNSPNKERAKLAKELKRKLEQLQVTEFPKMRAAFAKRMAEEMWERDIYVKAVGSRNNIIEFVGAIYAANINIKKTQEILKEGLMQYRFKQAQYRWYKYATEYTYYTIYKGSDRDPVAKLAN